ncbi:ANKRD17 [Symbiodinium sp. KB8]|nr:ANKRD17 [Symbiodinium sp. KB8]
MLVVESAMHQTLVGEAHGMLNAPGDGKFTDESDRTSLGPVIVQMVWNKLVYFLEQGDWHSYRCMLNEQRVRYLKSLDVDPIDGLIPKPPTNIDPFSSPQTFVLARFLHQNGFQSPLERDARGWSPLCFAAMNGDVMLVEALLDSKADVNDAITKAKKEMFFGGYSETVSFLIEVKADVNERFQVRLQEPVWWLIMNMAGIRHRLSPSRLTSLAYHHAGATPLMFSILSGYFEATSLLLASGARFSAGEDVDL